MKKQTYMAPSTEVLTLTLQNMIAVSGEGPTQVYSNPEDGINDASKILSRRFSIWGDDEEE